MRIIWRGDSDPLELINGKEYEVVGVGLGGDWFSVIDETGEDYLYPAEDCEIISGSVDEFANERSDKDE